MISGFEDYRLYIILYCFSLLRCGISIFPYYRNTIYKPEHLPLMRSEICLLLSKVGFFC